MEEILFSMVIKEKEALGELEQPEHDSLNSSH